VLSIAISLVAVFIPLLFMSGLIGRLFREFAITMTVAVLISLVISLTTTPMLASVILRDHSERKPDGRLAQFSERQFQRVQAGYERSLDWALANRGAMLLMLAGAVALNIFLLVVVQKGFFPEQDTGSLMGGLRADRSISFQDMQKKLTTIVDLIRKDKSVATVVAFTGGSRAGGGFMFVTLKPQSQRDSSRVVIDRLRPKLAKITGVSTFLSPVQDMRVGGRAGNSTYQYSLKADDSDMLRQAADKMLVAMKKDRTLTDVDSDRADGGAEVYVKVDRDSATRLGVTAQAVDNALYDAFGQRQVSTIYSGLNQYHVVMGVAPEYTGAPEALEDVYLPGRKVASTTTTTASAAAAVGTSATVSGSTPVSTTGQRDTTTGAAVNTSASTMMPLSAIAQWATGSTDSQINHDSGAPATTLSFATATGVSLGEASLTIAQIQRDLHLPTGVVGSFAGTAKVFQQSTASMPVLIVSALLVIYIVLGILYESAIHPLTVLSTLPSAGIGAVIALMLAGAAFDLIGLIGLILLIGIVKKNAIMIIDFALDAERTRGLSPMQAIREASLLRFRPIVMTTFAAAFGALPLAIGFGEGAELRRPLGIAIMGGLVASQFLTLLTTPVVYLALDKFRKRSPRERMLARLGSEGLPA
jgi:multidrug efflux pump